MFFPRAVCAGVVICAIGACSSSADHDYASALAKAICEPLAPCCMANGFTFDKGQCELGGAAYAQSGNDNARMAGAMFDQKAADDCVAAVRTLAMSCKSGADDPALTEPCRRVWVGTKPPGAACSMDVECASGSGRGACVMKACVQLSTNGKVGDSCSTTDCNASGLQCDALGSKTCIEQTAMGQKCGTLTTCVKGAFCDSGTGTCAPTLAKGATCTANNQCSSNACIKGMCAANDLATSKPCNGT